MINITPYIYIDGKRRRVRDTIFDEPPPKRQQQHQHVQQHQDVPPPITVNELGPSNYES